jgi:hypothetical protein
MKAINTHCQQYQEALSRQPRAKRSDASLLVESNEWRNLLGGYFGHVKSKLM